MSVVLDAISTPVAFEQLDTVAAVGFTEAIHHMTKNTGAKRAVIQAIGGDINWRCDDTDPVVGSAGGMLLASGESFLYTFSMANFKCINTVAASGAKLNVMSAE